MIELEVTDFLSDNKYIAYNADDLRAIIYSWTGLPLENLTRVDARWINTARGLSYKNPFGVFVNRRSIILDILVNIITYFCGTDPDDMLMEQHSSFTTLSPGEMFSVTWDHQPVTLPGGSKAGRKKNDIAQLKQANVVRLLDELLKAKPLMSVTNEIRTYNQTRHWNIAEQDHDTIPANYAAPSLVFFPNGSRPSFYY